MASENMSLPPAVSALYESIQQASALTPEVKSQINKISNEIFSNPDAISHEAAESLIKHVYSISTPKDHPLIHQIHEQWKLDIAVHTAKRGDSDKNLKDMLPTKLHYQAVTADLGTLEGDFILATAEELFQPNAFDKTPMDYALERGMFSAVDNALDDPNLEIPEGHITNIIMQLVLSGAVLSEDKLIGSMLTKLEENLQSKEANGQEFSKEVNTLRDIVRDLKIFDNERAPMPAKCAALERINQAKTSLPDKLKKDLTTHISNEYKPIESKAEQIQRFLAGDANSGLNTHEEISVLCSQHPRVADKCKILDRYLTENYDTPERKEKLRQNRTNAADTFLLDKVYYDRATEGGVMAHQAKIVLDAYKETLQKIMDNPSSPIAIEVRENEQLLNSLVDSLTFYAALSNSEVNLGLYTIADIMACQDTETPLLLPVRYDSDETNSGGHAMAMSYKPDGHGNSTICLHDTSVDGLADTTNPQTNKAITYHRYDNVPVQNIQSESLSKLYAVSPEPGRDAFMARFDTFIQGGVRNNDVDSIHYESKQYNGGCTAQCIMSFLRAQILDNVEGSNEHKLGLYKFVKNELLITIGEQCREHISNEDTLEHLDDKMALHRADTDLAKSASTDGEHSAAENYYLQRENAKHSEESTEFGDLWKQDSQELDDSLMNGIKYLAKEEPENIGVFFSLIGSHPSPKDVTHFIVQELVNNHGEEKALKVVRSLVGVAQESMDQNFVDYLVDNINEAFQNVQAQEPEA